MLDKEFKYYLAHQNELLPMYDGKYVMIVGEKVVGAYDTISEAYYKGRDQYGLGNYLVQLCTPGNSAYTTICRSSQVVTNCHRLKWGTNCTPVDEKRNLKSGAYLGTICPYVEEKRDALTHLKGCVSLPENFDYKADIADYLVAKYR